MDDMKCVGVSCSLSRSLSTSLSSDFSYLLVLFAPKPERTLFKTDRTKNNNGLPEYSEYL
jgi:hypothetical protein